MFERPELLWLLLAAPLAALPGVAAARAGRWRAGIGAAVLRTAVFATLVALLAGLRLPLRTPAHRMSVWWRWTLRIRSRPTSSSGCASGSRPCAAR